MIEINGIEPRDEARQIAFFTVDSQQFSCGNVPASLTKTTDIQAHLDARADEFNLLILRKQYPESDHKRFQKEDMTEFQSMKAWIVAGHKNKIQIGLTVAGKPKFEYRIVEKRELDYKHPKEIEARVLINKATSIDDIKAILHKIL